MNTNRLTLSVIALAVVIATGILVWQQHRLALSRAEIGRLRSEIAPLTEMREELVRLRRVEVDYAELGRLRETQAATQTELARLRAQASRTLHAESEAMQLRSKLDRQADRGTETPGGISAPMADLMQDAVKQITQRRLTRMQERLNLSPEQTQAIQEIFNRRAEGIAEATRGVILGKIDHQKLAAIRQGNGDPETQIRALLSPEQQSAYVAFKEEEKLNQASSTANSEFLQMQRTLDLREDQQDKVFAVLYDQALRQSTADADGPEPANPAEAMQILMDRKLQALEGVLTPTQLAGYLQQQELRLKFMKRLANQMEPSVAQP